jgi:hypothetical protein
MVPLNKMIILAQSDNSSDLQSLAKDFGGLVPIILSFPFFFFLGIVVTGWLWGYTLAISREKESKNNDYSGLQIPGYLSITSTGEQVKIGILVFLSVWFFVGIFLSDTAWDIIVVNMGFPENRLIASTGFAAFISIIASGAIAIVWSFITFVATRIYTFLREKEKKTPSQIVQVLIQEEPELIEVAID